MVTQWDAPAAHLVDGYWTVIVLVSMLGPLPSAPPLGSSVSHWRTTSPVMPSSGISASKGKSLSSIQPSDW